MNAAPYARLRPNYRFGIVKEAPKKAEPKKAEPKQTPKPKTEPKQTFSQAFAAKRAELKKQGKDPSSGTFSWTDAKGVTRTYNTKMKESAKPAAAKPAAAKRSSIDTYKGFQSLGAAQYGVIKSQKPAGEAKPKDKTKSAPAQKRRRRWDAKRNKWVEM